MRTLPALTHDEQMMMRRIIAQHLDGSHPNPAVYRAYVSAEKRALAHASYYPSRYAWRCAFVTLKYQRRQQQREQATQ